MTYWNPVERYGVDAVRRRPGGRRRRRADHARPHPRTRRADWLRGRDAHGLDRVFLVAPPRRPSGSARTAASLPRLRLRRVDDGRHRDARPPSVPRPARWSPGCARPPTCRSCVGLGVSQRRSRRPRSRLRRRRHRRLGVRPRAARRRSTEDGGLAAVRALAGELAAGVRGAVRRLTASRRSRDGPGVLAGCASSGQQEAGVTVSGREGLERHPRSGTATRCRPSRSPHRRARNDAGSEQDRTPVTLVSPATRTARTSATSSLPTRPPRCAGDSREGPQDGPAGVRQHRPPTRHHRGGPRAASTGSMPRFEGLVSPGGRRRDERPRRSTSATRSRTGRTVAATRSTTAPTRPGSWTERRR